MNVWFLIWIFTYLLAGYLIVCGFADAVQDQRKYSVPMLVALSLVWLPASLFAIIKVITVERKVKQRASTKRDSR